MYGATGGKNRGYELLGEKMRSDTDAGTNKNYSVTSTTHYPSFYCKPPLCTL